MLSCVIVREFFSPCYLYPDPMFNNFVLRPLSPVFRDALNFPCRCSRQNGVVSFKLQTSNAKKGKPTEEVEDQLDKKKNTKLKNEIEIDDILSKQEEKAYNLLASL